MKANYIQTLHPIAGKINKNISLEKYEKIKEALLHVLSYSQPTHMQLMEEMYSQLKNNFDGNVQWYGETVKLDLEARNIITRTKSNPVTYKLVKE